MSNTVYGLRLNPRQAWAWRRLGNPTIRELIAPSGVCVQCGSQAAQSNTRNSWFCYPCQDALDQENLLPEPETSLLQKENRRLRAEITRLRTELEPPQHEENHSSTQLSLFPTD